MGEKKEGINFVKIIISFTYLSWVVALLFAFVLIDVSEYHVEFRDKGRIIQGILFTLIGILCLVMDVLLLNLYRKRKKLVIKYLMGYFVLTGPGVILQGVFGIIEFTVRDFQTFWTDSALVFITGAILCLGCFIFEVFKKGIEQPQNQKHLKIFSLALITTNLLIIINTIWKIEMYLLIVPALVLLYYALFTFTTLIIQSFKLRKRIESPIEKRAFYLIGIHGILLLCGGLSAAIYSIVYIFEIRYITTILLALAYYSLYKGVTLPMKNKKKEENETKMVEEIEENGTKEDGPNASNLENSK